MEFFMRGIPKLIFVSTLITSGYCIANQQPSLKEGFNIALASSEVKSGLKCVKDLIGDAIKLHIHYLSPARIFETPADRILWVTAAWLLCVETQVCVDLANDFVDGHDDRGWFEWLFSLRTKRSNTFSTKKSLLPPNAIRTLAAALSVVVALEIAAQ